MKRFFFFFAMIAINQGCRVYEIVDDEPAAPLNPARQTYDLRGFDQLDVRDALQLVATARPTFRVYAEGDSTDLADLRVEVSGTTLSAGYVRRRARRYPMRLEVDLPALTQARLSGAVSAEAQGFHAAGDLRLDLSGATRLQGTDVQASGLKLSLSGASSVLLAGKATRLEADVRGASTLGAFDCPTEEATLSVNGASNARVWVTRQLDVTATGASSVHYRGQPTTKISTSGGSTVSSP